MNPVMKNKKSTTKALPQLTKKKKKNIYNKFQSNPTIKRILKQSEGEEEREESSRLKRKVKNNKYKST